MGRSTGYSACAFPLMRRYYMAGPTGPAGISSLHTDNRLGIPYCPWQSGTSAMERHLELEPDFPPDPYSEPDIQDCVD